MHIIYIMILYSCKAVPLMPDFRLSTTILNPLEIFLRWCKLNFGLLQGHVKSYHFTPFLLK